MHDFSFSEAIGLALLQRANRIERIQKEIDAMGADHPIAGRIYAADLAIVEDAGLLFNWTTGRVEFGEAWARVMGGDSICQG